MLSVLGSVLEVRRQQGCLACVHVSDKATHCWKLDQHGSKHHEGLGCTSCAGWLQPQLTTGSTLAGLVLPCGTGSCLS
jgi:hypothetical protein